MVITVLQIYAFIGIIFAIVMETGYIHASKENKEVYQENKLLFIVILILFWLPILLSIKNKHE